MTTIGACGRDLAVEAPAIGDAETVRTIASDRIDRVAAGLAIRAAIRKPRVAVGKNATIARVAAAAAADARTMMIAARVAHVAAAIAEARAVADGSVTRPVMPRPRAAGGKIVADARGMRVYPSLPECKHCAAMDLAGPETTSATPTDAVGVALVAANRVRVS